MSSINARYKTEREDRKTLLEEGREGRGPFECQCLMMMMMMMMTAGLVPAPGQNRRTTGLG